MPEKEPFVRIVKRNETNIRKTVLIYAVILIAAVLLSGLLLRSLTQEGLASLYDTIIKGAVGSSLKRWTTLRETMILLGVALALTPAFRMKFWNIGAEGQILIGGICTAAVMKYCENVLPAPVLFAVMIAASVLSGLVWGIIPAIFKAIWNTNETLFTLMFNYIAIQITAFFSVYWEQVKGSGVIGILNKQSKVGWIPTNFLSGIFGKYNFFITVLIVAILALLLHLYMKYTKQGYEISVIGDSENTALYAGIPVKKVIIRTMALSGAIAGFMGFLIVSGASHTISTVTANGRGFTAIIVAWLAQFNPIFMFLISFLLIFLDQGAAQIASTYNLNESASSVVTGLILFFILASDFFVRYRLVFRFAHKEEKA